jgi:poly(hydroxyalkanoate) depolymerase family esterase
MLVHVPNGLPSTAPLVVALHGCNQTADEYAPVGRRSPTASALPWFILSSSPATIQRILFSWFMPGDASRGRGEAQSIQQMIEHAIMSFGVDRQRVFVTGLSAGGAMAAVMLATYPEILLVGLSLPHCCLLPGCLRRRPNARGEASSPAPSVRRGEAGVRFRRAD